MLVHKVELRSLEKKIAEALFMYIRRAFDYISKGKLFTYMINLGIDSNLIA